MLGTFFANIWLWFPRYWRLSIGGFSSRLSFVTRFLSWLVLDFAPRFLHSISNSILDDQSSGYWFSFYCCLLNIIASWWSFHLDKLLKILCTVPAIIFLLYCIGLQQLKFKNMPVTVVIWYYPNLAYLLPSTFVLLSTKANSAFSLGVSSVNCKLGCKLLAACNTTLGLPLTILTISST